MSDENKIHRLNPPALSGAQFRLSGQSLQPVPQIVEMLETALVAARAGKLRGAALAGVTIDAEDGGANTTTGWQMEGDKEIYALYAAVTRLHMRFGARHMYSPSDET